MTFGPSPSIALLEDNRSFRRCYWSRDSFDFDSSPYQKELTRSRHRPIRLAPVPTLHCQPAGSAGLLLFRGIRRDRCACRLLPRDVLGRGILGDPVKLLPPLGSFTFSPAICTENGSYGVYSVNVVAVAGGRLWHATTSAITSPFSSWTMIGSDAASSPDCAVAGGADGDRPRGDDERLGYDSGCLMARVPAGLTIDLGSPALAELSHAQPLRLEHRRAGDLLGDQVRIVRGAVPAEEPVAASQQVRLVAEDRLALLLHAARICRCSRPGSRRTARPDRCSTHPTALVYAVPQALVPRRHRPESGGRTDPARRRRC